MKVNVFYTGEVHATTGKEIETFEIDNGTSARKLLSILIDMYGDRFRDSIMDSKSTLQSPWLKVMISVNGRDVRALGGLDKELSDGDSFTFVTMVSGG